MQNADACRFDHVCARCSSECNNVAAGVTVGEETAVPVCDVVPTGSKSADVGGTTLETLELNPGYYRTSNRSHVVLECFRESSCLGGIDPNSYCADGYDGPCETEMVLHFTRGVHASPPPRTDFILRTNTIAKVPLLMVVSVYICTDTSRLLPHVANAQRERVRVLL